MARHTASIASRSVVRIVRYWRLFAGSQALNCELCRTDEALELRCGTDTGRPVRTERVEDARFALALAEQWRAEYLRDEAGYHQSPNDDAYGQPRPRTVFELRGRHRRNPGVR